MKGRREAYLACKKFQLGLPCEVVGIPVPVKQKQYPSSDIYNFIHYEKVPKQEKTDKKNGFN